MRGRRPKPAALKEAQGNPGHRTIVDTPAPAPTSDAARVVSGTSFPFKVSDDAQRLYDLIAPELQRLNFLRATDEPAFRRYCDTLARYWRVTEQMEQLGGETYECKTTTGETMLRLRPQFVVQERLARRLDTLEDRFGLTPMARQQYMLTVSRGSQMGLFAPQKPPQQQQPESGTGPAQPLAQTVSAATLRPSVIGGARGSTTIQ